MINKTNLITKPFLKWPGGKSRLIPFLLKHLPEQPILVEPFVGAGAVFANTSHHKIFLNDINQDLINIYTQVKKNNRCFAIESQKFFHTKYNKKKIYYQLRDAFNQSTDTLERACLFLYLNRHGYNGLCRYNLKGKYNVPFGDYSNPYYPQKEIEFFKRRLRQANLTTLSFIQFMEKMAKHKNISKMVFYCDPPYVPLSNTANFTGYAACKFSLKDQEKLAEIIHALMDKGAKVMISNHDTPFTRSLYRLGKIETVQVQRAISCDPKNRSKVKELVAIYK